MQRMRLAACQEMFVDKSWDWQFSFLREAGYEGVEIAPFTLDRPVHEMTALERDELRSKAARHEIEIIGLHWLLARTEGYYLNSADAETSTRTADYLAELARLCADLGGKVLVLGSPLQRKILPGLTVDQANDFACRTLEPLLPVLEQTDTYLCLEPLGRKETDYWNTCEEVVDIIKRIGSSHLKLHQDVKAMLDEPTPIPELIKQFKNFTYHFHVNDGNLLGPGMGETNFVPIFRALQESGYEGWLSLEVFDYSPGSEHIAKVSREYLLDVWRLVTKS